MRVLSGRGTRRDGGTKPQRHAERPGCSSTEELSHVASSFGGNHPGEQSQCRRTAVPRIAVSSNAKMVNRQAWNAVQHPDPEVQTIQSNRLNRAEALHVSRHTIRP